MKHRLTITELEPPRGLSAAVFARIERGIAARNARRKAVGLSLAGLSFAASVWVIVYAVGQFQASAFGSYLSLAFSDTKIVLGNFGVFLASLAGSLPVFAVTLLLVSCAAAMLSIRYAANLEKDIDYQLMAAR